MCPPKLARAAGALLALSVLAFGGVRDARAGLFELQSPETGVVHGIITTQTNIPLGGVRVSLFDGATELLAIASEGDGSFRFENLKPGRYTVTALLEGFESVTLAAVVAAGQTTEIPIDLRLAMIAERVEVVAPAPVVPAAGTLSSSTSVEARELEQISPGGGVQSALRLIAGVIEVPGGVAIKGGRPSQAGMQLGPGMFVDPATGITQGSLPDDAIDSVTVLPNPYAVEFGRFSSGLVVIQTRRAADQWRVRLNQLDPAFRTRRHKLFEIVGISSFNPRMEVGGPIVKDKLYVQQALQYRYRSNDIPSRSQDDVRTSHRFSSFTRADANLSPRHSLVGVAGFFPSLYKFTTLGTFTPPEATVDTRGDVNTAAVTERALWSDRFYSETTVEVNRYMTDVRPQGSALMELLPETTVGNFFNRQRRETTAFQVVETFSGTSGRGGGLHLYKFGFDLLHTRLDATSSSRAVLIRRSDGTLARRLDFTASSPLSVRSNDFAIYAQDRYQPNTRWYLEFGGRIDRDDISGRTNLTPRVGAAVLLNESGNAVIRSGYGLFFERTPSAAGAFEQYESYVETRYAADGTTPLAPPIRFQHTTMPRLRTSQSRTWDVAFDQRFNPRWALHMGVIDRRGSHELIVDPVMTGPTTAALLMQSTGRSLYREAEIGFHFTAGARADLNATYARSQARADLNAFTSFFDSVLVPVIGRNQYGPARADAPNRLLARGRWMPTALWLVVGILDWRDGLPFSPVNEMVDFVGARNSERFPTYFRLDVGLEHRFKLFGREPWIGIRADNVLNSWLPVDVQANVTSPAYRTFYNSEFRQFRLQVRFE
jgi:hypothetical protein